MSRLVVNSKNCETSHSDLPNFMKVLGELAKKNINKIVDGRNVLLVSVTVMQSLLIKSSERKILHQRITKR